MFPSVTSESIALLPLSSRDQQDIALTPDAVMKQTSPHPHGGLVYRHQGRLFWGEHEDVSSLHCRVNYINSVVSHIRQTMPNKCQPLTLISLGAGGLLMESFIHTQLRRVGYSEVNWRVIDIDYGQDNCKQCHSYQASLDAFAEVTQGHLSAYRSDQRYFNSSHGRSGGLDDRSRGATVLLVIDPPATQSQASGNACINPIRMSVCGRVVEDIADANCIYVIACKSENRALAQQALAALARGDSMITLENIIKCYINKFGGSEVLSTQSERSLLMKKESEFFLERAKIMQASPSASTQEITLPDIKHVLERYIATKAESPLYYTSCCVSDYDISLMRLRDYVVDNHHSTLLATLQMNITHIERYP